MTTIEEIYAAINPMPAMLSEKGKVEPRVTIEFEANARVMIWLRWKKEYNQSYSSEQELKVECGNTVEEAVAKTMAFIDALPSTKDVKLQTFMAALGHVIDDAREQGIEVEFLNPLTDTMKRLSENIITYQPEGRAA